MRTGPEDTSKAIMKMRAKIDERASLPKGDGYRRFLARDIRNLYLIIRMDLCGWEVGEIDMLNLRANLDLAKRQGIRLAKLGNPVTT